MRERRALQDRLELVDGRQHLHDHADEVTSRVDDERRMAEVRRALSALPGGQQEAVELVLWEGLTIAEAAHALGVAEGTVKSRVSRARKRLGELLADPGQEIS